MTAIMLLCLVYDRLVLDVRSGIVRDSYIVRSSIVRDSYIKYQPHHMIDDYGTLCNIELHNLNVHVCYKKLIILHGSTITVFGLVVLVGHGHLKHNHAGAYEPHARWFMLLLPRAHAQGVK